MTGFWLGAIVVSVLLFVVIIRYMANWTDNNETGE